MSRRIITEIIENFKQQELAYSHMLDLASEQLAILEKSQGNVPAGEIDGLLRQRKEYLERINEDNRKNKELQQRAIKELGIEGFVLSQLENKLESEQQEALKKQIIALGKLLENTSEKDLLNHELMRQAIEARRQKRRKPLSSSRKASQAYLQSKPEKD